MVENSIRNKEWASLSAIEKAEIMKIAIQNGISDLESIKNAYNSFADGGDINTTQIYTEDNGQSFFVENSDKSRVYVSPINTLGSNNPGEWTYQDENGKTYSPHRNIRIDTVTQGKDLTALDRLYQYSNANYQNPILGIPARFADSWHNDRNAVKGLLSSMDPTGLGEYVIDKGIDIYQEGKEALNWGDAVQAGLVALPFAGKYMRQGQRLLKKSGILSPSMRGLSEYHPFNSIEPIKVKHPSGDIAYTTPDIPRGLARNVALKKEGAIKTVPISGEEKATFSMLYNDSLKKQESKYGLEDFILNSNYDAATKNMLYRQPEFTYFIKETGLDPNNANTIELFIKRQQTSLRGVTASSDDEAVRYLTETQKGRHQHGGDRLNTDGGLYTSNSTGIADRFKNNVGAGNQFGYIGKLSADFNIDRTLPINDQLNQIRSKIALSNNSNILSINRGSYKNYLKRAKNNGAIALEAEYAQRNGTVLPVTERAYLPENIEGQVNNPVKIETLSKYIDASDKNGRWGSGITHVTEDNDLFIPRMLNNSSDFVSFSRAALSPRKSVTSKYFLEEAKLSNLFRDQKSKRDILYRQLQDANDKVRTATAVSAITGSAGLGVYELVKLGRNNSIEEYEAAISSTPKGAKFISDTNKSNLSKSEYLDLLREYYKANINDIYGFEDYDNNSEVKPIAQKALGGYLYSDGGYIPSYTIKDRIARWEGKTMTQSTVDPLSGKVVKKNNSFENEARNFYSVLPDSIKEQVLSNQELADNLFSYSYNVGAHKFKKRVVPALERYYSGNGSIEEIENSMWASGDSQLRGLQKRRAEERAGVRNALSNNRQVARVQEESIRTTPWDSFITEVPGVQSVDEVQYAQAQPVEDTPIFFTSSEATQDPYTVQLLSMLENISSRKKDPLMDTLNTIQNYNNF